MLEEEDRLYLCQGWLNGALYTERRRAVAQCNRTRRAHRLRHAGIDSRRRLGLTETCCDSWSLPGWLWLQFAWPRPSCPRCCVSLKCYEAKCCGQASFTHRRSFRSTGSYRCKRRRSSGAISIASHSFELDLFITCTVSLVLGIACCCGYSRIRHTCRLQQVLWLLMVTRDRKYGRMQLLFRALSRMRNPVFRSKRVHSLESVGGLGCAGLHVETTPPDAFFETGGDKLVFNGCLVHPMIEAYAYLSLTCSSRLSTLSLLR